MNSWLITFQPRKKPRLRLICFPYAGGSASMYRQWTDSLPVSGEVYAVQLPGHETRFTEHLVDNLTELAEALLPSIGSHLDVPFAFFGHSMGALFAFETARALVNRYNVLPTHLFVSGYGAPHIYHSPHKLHQLADQDFISALRLIGGTPVEIFSNREMLQLLLPIWRADFCAVENYLFSGTTRLNCPISAYIGIEDYDHTTSVAAWQDQTTKKFLLTTFPGGHFYLLAERHLLLKKLNSDLSPYIAEH